jgi:hypothetical protein
MRYSNKAAPSGVNDKYPSDGCSTVSQPWAIAVATAARYSAEVPLELRIDLADRHTTSMFRLDRIRQLK